MKRCPYHQAPTPADYEIEYEYGDVTIRNAVDTVCEAHFEMHKASLKAARTIKPVRIRRIIR